MGVTGVLGPPALSSAAFPHQTQEGPWCPGPSTAVEQLTALKLSVCFSLRSAGNYIFNNLRCINFYIYNTLKFPINVQSSAICKLYWHTGPYKAVILIAQTVLLSPERGSGSTGWSCRKHKPVESLCHSPQRCRAPGTRKGEGFFPKSSIAEKGTEEIC